MKNFIHILVFIFLLPLHAQRSDFNKINFNKAEKIAKQHKGEDLYNLPILAFKLTTSLNTDAERFRAIYYWVCHNIRGENDLMNKNNRQLKKLKNDPDAERIWNKQFKKNVFNKLRDDKETLCIGYAYLIKELSNLAGIECEIIYGYGLANNVKLKNIEAPNHSWNAVKLNGEWYLCDATWSSGFFDESINLFEFDYDDSYFLMEPTKFAISHKPVDKAWNLILNKPEINANY